MVRETTHCWILDSGGAGRGAWQGGVIYEFMHWTRQMGCYPLLSMGASAGGYAAADVATGTEATVMKGWTQWGLEKLPPPDQVPRELRSFWGFGEFRLHLIRSIRYVMSESELDRVFNNQVEKKLLVFTTRVRRLDQQPFQHSDAVRYFLKSLTRKLPGTLKYLPRDYIEEPVVFATNLPEELQSVSVRPLRRENFHAVIEASCLVPLAMGAPLQPNEVTTSLNMGEGLTFASDRNAVFIDGGFSMKMPMRIFERDLRFRDVALWAVADKTVVFCCNRQGNLWETSSRFRRLNSSPQVQKALEENRLLIISPDHKIEAGFLCYDNGVTMRTFRRGQEQATQLLRSEVVRRFFGT
jgi:Patatin-like phospholipase